MAIYCGAKTNGIPNATSSTMSIIPCLEPKIRQRNVRADLKGYSVLHGVGTNKIIHGDIPIVTLKNGLDFTKIIQHSAPSWGLIWLWSSFRSNEGMEPLQGLRIADRKKRRCAGADPNLKMITAFSWWYNQTYMYNCIPSYVIISIIEILYVYMRKSQ